MAQPTRPNAIDHVLSGVTPTPWPRLAEDERRELDHRLANSLQLAADFLIFEHTRLSDPAGRAALIAAAERLSAVGQMHRFLAARAEGTSVALCDFLGDLAGLIGESTGLICDVDAEPIEVTPEMAQQLAIVVNELAMNAAKHAYPWGSSGPLHIALRRRGASLCLAVADEGCGLGPGYALRRGGRESLGMTIVQAIIRQLGGQLQATTAGGARFVITAPLPRPRRTEPRSFAPIGEDGLS